MKKNLLMLLASFALAGGAAAQPVYKYKDTHGTTVYTDNPRAGNGKAQRVEGDQLSIAPGASESSVAGADRQLLDDAEKRSGALDRATDDIVAASRALREAEDRRDLGIEPIEGERQGRRFRPEYWKRQQQLQSDVSSAQARLDEALARRNSLR
jgi:hypothetical protein